MTMLLAFMAPFILLFILQRVGILPVTINKKPKSGANANNNAFRIHIDPGLSPDNY